MSIEAGIPDDGSMVAAVALEEVTAEAWGAAEGELAEDATACGWGELVAATILSDEGVEGDGSSFHATMVRRWDGARLVEKGVV